MASHDASVKFVWMGQTVNVSLSLVTRKAALFPLGL